MCLPAMLKRPSRRAWATTKKLPTSSKAASRTPVPLGSSSSDGDRVEVETKIFHDDLGGIAARAARDAAAWMCAAAGHIELGDRRAVLTPARHRPIPTELPVVEADVLDVGLHERVVVALNIQRRLEVHAENVLVLQIGGQLLQVLDESPSYRRTDLVPLAASAV